MWPPLPHLHQLAQDWVDAFTGATEPLARLNAYYQRSFTLADLKAEIWRRVYAFRQRSSRANHSHYLLLAEAQLLLAQDAGFPSWDAFLHAAATGTPSTEPAFDLDLDELTLAPRRRLNSSEWTSLIAIMREHQVRSFEAQGFATDAALAQLATLPHLTRLSLGGSRELSDAGLRHLARMPQLEYLELNEYPGGKLTDGGLEVLAQLPNLREFEMTWQAGVTDSGLAHLRHCPLLERVDLMGSPTGDGVIEALQGLPHLRRLATGRLTTDAGLALLPNLPQLRDPASPGFQLLLDGPFTDAGLSRLAGLPGLHDLDLFWHVSALSPHAFAHLTTLPNLASLGCDGKLSSDASMPHIAAIPNLRRLRIQESAATDDGFVALARSQSLESIWGRVCEHFASRGFLAFAQMSNLRNLGIGLANVSPEALAALPSFPSLRDLTPIGLQDDGFLHVGRCANLERLTCMYCRDTTDAATAHITALNIRSYYAGLTQITDRSLELLSTISTLEHIEFYECLHLTPAGLPHLARLPNLKEVRLGSLPHIALADTRVFPPHVKVRHSN